VRHLDAPLLAVLARATEQHVGELKPQELANTLWAFARVGRFNALLFVALTMASEQHMDELKSQ